MEEHNPTILGEAELTNIEGDTQLTNMEGDLRLYKPIMLSEKDINELNNIIIREPNISNVLKDVLVNKKMDSNSGLYKLDDVSNLITLIQTEIDRMNVELDTNLQPYNRVLELLNRESSTDYDEMKWRVFTTEFYNIKKNTRNFESYNDFMTSTGLNKSIPVQRVELYTYYEYDPEIMKNLYLQLYEDMESVDIPGFNENKFINKFPIIQLNSESNPTILNRFESGDNLLFMVNDGGLISKKGDDAIWDETNTSSDQNNHTLRFRYTNPFDITGSRLLHKSNRVLNNAGHSLKHIYKTTFRGGKTRKRSKRQSKSKTQRRRKSKSKTQRRRKSTLKKSAKSKRRYRK
jgi:hypothetical protein